MDANPITVRYQKKNSLIVHRATTVMSIRRSVITEEMKIRFKDEPDFARRFGAINLYPSVAACTVAKTLPTVEEFLEMDTSISDPWVDAAVKKNPHWFEFEITQEEDEKKES